jgi:hypothetical protein
MSMGPELARTTYTKYGETFRMIVKGGLHMIDGNSAPYFSLTSSVDRKARNGRWVEDSGGANHEEIVKHFPRFADLAALHLSDIDGVPMHAVSNGFYWLAGYFGEPWVREHGQRFHGGNSQSGDRTSAECLKVFADHMRYDEHDARFTAEVVRDALDPKETFRFICEAEKPRWKREADACIETHGLKVYGAPWPKVSVEA